MSRLLPVDMHTSVMCREGKIIVFEKEFEISEDVIERGKADRPYRMQVIGQMVNGDIAPAILSQEKPNFFCCEYCDGSFRKFAMIPSGFTMANDQGRIPCRIFLIPTCGGGACQIEAVQKFNKLMKQTVKETGHLQHKPSRGIQLCANCRQMDDNSESYKRCSRCRVTYYCSKECQNDHWKEHKKVCKAPIK